MENFFGLLKQEIYYGVVYYSYEELKDAIEKYIKYSIKNVSRKNWDGLVLYNTDNASWLHK